MSSLINSRFISSLRTRRYISTYKMSSKPQVLRVGNYPQTDKEWAALGEYAEVIDSDAQTREEFINNLKTKYPNLISIARTFDSIKQTGRFDEEIANALPKSVKSLLHTGAGYDQIDVQPFTDRGIQVSNVTVPVEAPTADTAIYLSIAATRNYQIGHNLAVQGEWLKAKSAGAPIGHCPEGRVAGILGLGGIGRAIHRRLKPFGYEKVIYHNRSRLSPDLEDGAEYTTFDDLLAQSDVLFISVPLNKNTTGLINKESFAKMKNHVTIVNTARGAVIDEDDLIVALKEGSIGALGSDVFSKEPQVPQELLDMPNVVSLPHMGTHTYEAIHNLEAWVVSNIELFLLTGKVKTVVPEQNGIDFGVAPVVTKK